MSEKKLREVMSNGIITVRFDETLSNIVGMMTDENISCLVIVDQNDGAIGIVSSLDIVKAFGEKTPSEISETKAEDIMTPLVYNVNPEMTLTEVSNIMVVKGIHRVVVLSEEGSRKPIGLLSATDIVKEVRQLNGYDMKKQCFVKVRTTEGEFISAVMLRYEDGKRAICGVWENREVN